MKTGQEFFNEMSERYFSDKDENLYYDENLYSEDELNSAFQEGYELAQREFGLKSKAVGALMPGSWHAKEAAKLAYDRDDYINKRTDYVMSGLVAPISSSNVRRTASMMTRAGRSKEQVRDYVENRSGNKRRRNEKDAEIVANMVTGTLSSGLTTIPGIIYAWGDGIGEVGRRQREIYRDKKEKALRQKAETLGGKYIKELNDFTEKRKASDAKEMAKINRKLAKKGL